LAAFQWTQEKLIALEPKGLENVRVGATKRGDKELAAWCDEIQLARKKPTLRVSDSVIGFHFICHAEYEVTELPDGTFWSGVWAVKEDHCDIAMELGGYVALHESKLVLSYRQGKIVEWKLEPRTKGKTAMGISFLLEPLTEALRWYGNASGERGYRRLSDSPKWTVPRSQS
jgi:hypothetical protein